MRIESLDFTCECVKSLLCMRHLSHMNTLCLTKAFASLTIYSTVERIKEEIRLQVVPLIFVTISVLQDCSSNDD